MFTLGHAGSAARATTRFTCHQTDLRMILDARASAGPNLLRKTKQLLRNCHYQFNMGEGNIIGDAELFHQAESDSERPETVASCPVMPCETRSVKDSP